MLAQGPLFTQADSIRGSITPERVWWNLTHYNLQLECNPETKEIAGSNTIRYTVDLPYQRMQVDLQPPLVVDSMVQNGTKLKYSSKGPNAFVVDLSEPQKTGESHELTVYYHGSPKKARHAPWDGGFSWTTDKDGNPFVATSCQGLGASAWWPCKDHMYDEPDSMRISITVPDPLMDVSNGRLVSTTVARPGWKTYTWEVKNPINNYGVNLNVGNYVSWSDTFQGERGQLDLFFFVLPRDLEAARKQFEQVPGMLRAMEHWFGPYPFYEDGYKLVQVPYLGMEHQSSVTYGNNFRNGYLGTDLSGSGWGMKWDYIIIHESGHEWFANNITYRDIADMWIHESFTTYSECLYTEFMFGKQAGAEYVIGQRKQVNNDRPIIGQYDVNEEGSGDMYFKGTNMLHTIRQVVNNDELWRQTLRGLNKDFYHQTVTTAQIENYMSEKTGKDLSKIFDQYLRTTLIPAFEYKRTKGKLQYRFANCVPSFNMPIEIISNKKTVRLNATDQWQTLNLKGTKDIDVDKDYYVKATKVK